MSLSQFKEKTPTKSTSSLDELKDDNFGIVTNVLMIYTGGTIGMKKGKKGYEPVSGFLQSQLKKLSAFHDPFAQPLKYELISPLSKYNRRANYTILEFDPLLDSANMSFTDVS